MSSGFQFLSHELGAVLYQFLMFGSESRCEVAINVQFAHYFAVNKYRHYDLRLGFQ